MNDDQIITLYENRDEQAIQETMNRYERYCRTVAGRILENTADVDEALADTWLRVWQAIPPHRPKHLHLFLAKITRNIYYGEMGYIYRLHVNTGAVDHIPLEDAQVSPIYLFTTPEHIGYVDDWNRLMLMTKDGAETRVIREGNCRNLYIDGTMLYTNDGSSLDRTDLTTGQTVTLAENTHGYFVDETSIYALTGNLDGFLRSQKETVAFEELPLSFHPAMTSPQVQ